MAKGDFSEERAMVGRSSYPPPHDARLAGRKTWSLTNQWKLTQFGVNRVEIPPGGWSTNRHWHERNDELVLVVQGEITVVTDEGEEVLRAGDCIGFKAGVPNAHHLQNRSDAPAVFFDVGGRDAWDVSIFPDIGLEARTRMEIEFRPIRERNAK
jgi:uncharacterized cupin superfamily protein